MSFELTPKLGFQGSSTTSAEATIFPASEDPLLRRSDAALELNGLTERSDNPAVVRLSVSQQLRSAGTFSITVKEPRGSRRALLDNVIDDDWLDIVQVVGGDRYHLMRGRIVAIQETTAVGGDGATTRTYEISGKGFGSVFEDTPIWYNQFRAENAAYQETIQIFQSLNVGGDPPTTVEKILYGFMESIIAKKRASWLLPRAMPGRAGTFADTFLMTTLDYQQDPVRQSVSTQLMDPNGQGIWALAQEWSDPMFCELFCDLIEAGTGQLLQPHRAYTPDQTQMGVIFRSIPFPRTASQYTVASRAKVDDDSAWFTLPTAIVQTQEIANKNVGRSGIERFNAFFVSPQVLQQVSGMLDTQGPLWDEADIEAHGLRQFSVESRYVADNASLFTMSAEQRWQALCFHALNPYLLNGTIALGHVRPDIRVGMRIRIPADDPELTETYYVESVSHSWSLGSARTTLGVTRGWRGSDYGYLAALQVLTSRYSLLRPEKDPVLPTVTVTPSLAAAGVVIRGVPLP